MKISGFSFARNADVLGYPIAQSIRSVLPICDEFIIAIGKGDAGDRTHEIVSEIGSPKIRTIDTEWTDRDRLKELVYSQQTNIALRACTGDWCFYIQADEVIHEKYLDSIAARCNTFLKAKEIDGLLFGYTHFWGDYDHIQKGHAWYPYEIRVVRNSPDIVSVGDAQSFRKNGKKLVVAHANACMFHYGYVRNPALMQTRNIEIVTTYLGAQKAKMYYKKDQTVFDFGPLNKCAIFKETHPAVLTKRIEEINWKHLLRYDGPVITRHHHDKLKYRFLTWIEKNMLGGRQIGGYKNYILQKNI
jgi:glycosyltransferase involved in cell wall biosynthesis